MGRSDINHVVPAQIAYDEIVSHIRQYGRPLQDWYAGVTSDWEKRLFTDHKVTSDDYFIRRCPSEQDARSVEKTLHEDGCDGASGGGDSSAVYVYVYPKTSQTIQ